MAAMPAAIGKVSTQAMRIERVPSPGETFINGQWLRVMGNRMVNEFRMHRVNENLQVGDQRMFDNVGSNTIFKDNQFLGLKGDQLDFGSAFSRNCGCARLGHDASL